MIKKNIKTLERLKYLLEATQLEIIRLLDYIPLISERKNLTVARKKLETCFLTASVISSQIIELVKKG